MTQEEKTLLLQDLCARLPYGVKINHQGYIQELTVIVLEDIIYSGHEVKPFLRPMESMTEEEKDKLRKLLWFGYPSDDYDINAHRGIEIASVLHDTWKNAEFDFEEFNDLQDFLNSIHIDYRGLIPMGLALPAPEGMYND